MTSATATSPRTPAERPPRTFVPVRPFIVRVTHWVNVFAMVCMTMSGWMIYAGIGKLTNATQQTTGRCANIQGLGNGD
jgi:hypothetical protein